MFSGIFQCSMFCRLKMSLVSIIRIDNNKIYSDTCEMVRFSWFSGVCEHQNSYEAGTKGSPSVKKWYKNDIVHVWGEGWTPVPFLAQICQVPKTQISGFFTIEIKMLDHQLSCLSAYFQGEFKLFLVWRGSLEYPAPLPFRIVYMYKYERHFGKCYWKPFFPSSQEYSALTFKRRPWFLNWYKTNFILYPLRLHYGNLMLILVHSALPWAHKSFISAPPRDEAIRDIAKLCPA